jgi:hypothetical protein
METIIAGVSILISIYYLLKPKRQEPTIGIRLIKL